MFCKLAPNNDRPTLVDCAHLANENTQKPSINTKCQNFAIKQIVIKCSRTLVLLISGSIDQVYVSES